MELKINKPFASNCSVDEDDVKAVKRTLNWLGYYTPPKNIGMSSIPDSDVFEALKDFQTDQNIRAIGEMRPNDETQNTLNQNILQQNWRT